ncbi:MAG: vWA domain-containing protein [Bacteroidota bacterium]|nr:vWA domain-containing protein [Bacteroidota bacterium]
MFLLFALCSLLLALFFYRYTVPQVTLAKKIVLSIIRSLVLIILMFIIFEPILSLINTTTKKPSIAVLIDNSRSMNIREGSNSDVENLKKFIAAKSLEKNLAGVDVKYYSFSSSLTGFEIFSPGSLKFSGDVTDISSALNQLKDQIRVQNHQAVVLISDGNYNVGKNPVYDAENLGVPVYTIGIGDTMEQKDVMISNIQTNNITYVDTRVPIDITVKWLAGANENVEVELNDGTQIIDRKIVTLTQSTAESRLRMFFEPKEEGTKKLTAAVSKIKDELTEKNNYQSVFVKVLKSKLQVLMIAGAPSADVAVVRQTLSEDQHISVSSLVQKNMSDFYERKLTRSLLDSSDCIVLIGFPNQASSYETLNLLKDAIDSQRKPVLFITAKNIDYNKLQTIDAFLPFSWSSVNNTELYVFPQIPEKMRAHPLINLDGGTSVESWQQLPPIYKVATMYRPKPESEMLASVRLENIQINEPLILTRNINRQKTLAVTAYGIWRWRLLSVGNPQTEKLLYLFLTNSVRWLTTKEDEKNVKIIPTKETYTTNEAVEFTGQVYNDQYRQVNDADVKVNLISGQEKYEILLNTIGSGRYEGSFGSIPEGDYSYAASAIRDGRTIGEDKGKFSVGKINIEFLDTRMNKQILEQIAYKTSGGYTDISKYNNLIPLITSNKFSSQEIVNVKEFELWNWEYVAGLLIILLAVEWFIRKRSGMV